MGYIKKEDLDRLIGAARLRKPKSVAEAHRWTFGAYRADPYGGQVTLIRTAQHPHCTREDLNWGRLLRQPPEIHIVPGDHYEMMMREPYVHQTVLKLRQVLDRVAQKRAGLQRNRNA